MESGGRENEKRNFSRAGLHLTCKGGSTSSPSAGSQALRPVLCQEVDLSSGLLLGGVNAGIFYMPSSQQVVSGRMLPLE